ncbi:hypothetical protein V2P20_09110 [Methylobacter sp. Wu1]|uniref:hypothetical protein n=1 Tax=Methylobacter sp. Wu1 TaxID=3119359 RepID=UPI002F94C225
MKPSSIKATSHSVGDWNGQEELAASNINRIYDAIYAAVDDDYDTDKLAQIIHDVWDDYGSDEKLLTITDNEIEGYVERVI